MSQPGSPDAAGGWDSFADTVLHFRSGAEWILDLRHEIDAPARIQFGQFGLEQSFGILTAQDPMGVRQTTVINTALAATLQQELAGVQAAHICVDACSPDQSHCEQSIAIALDLQSLIAIAYRYDQLAIFWFDGEAFWIIPVHSRNARLRLPVLI